jgi:hypothetical protein
MCLFETLPRRKQTDRYIRIDGYLQSYRYFEHVSDRLRQKEWLGMRLKAQQRNIFIFFKFSKKIAVSIGSHTLCGFCILTKCHRRAPTEPTI